VTAAAEQQLPAQLPSPRVRGAAVVPCSAAGRAQGAETWASAAAPRQHTAETHSLHLQRGNSNIQQQQRAQHEITKILETLREVGSSLEGCVGSIDKPDGKSGL